MERKRIKSMTTVLRDLIAKEKVVVAPGSFDALSAKIVESFGFKAVYVTGYGSEAALLGQPDMGFTTLTEATENGKRMAEVLNIPIIYDSDIGFGNAFNMYRTINEWIRAGVAGVHIEDQVSQRKQCPTWEHLGGRKRTLQPINVQVGKLKAAAMARDERDPDFVIVARTDSDVTGSYDEVVKRANAYADAGADLIMPMLMNIIAGKPRDEIKDMFKRLVKDVKVPLLMMDYDFTMKEHEEIGSKVVILPTMTFTAAERAMFDVVEELKKRGTPTGYFKTRPPIDQETHWDMLGRKKYLEIDKKFILE